MKATAIAPSNIAFIKYWGKKVELLRLPTNGSISMNLSNLLTTTTVEFSEKYDKDSVVIDTITERCEQDRVIRHLDRIRKMAGLKLKAKVVSKNNFPAKTGLSSSASGFAALTMAASVAANLKLEKKELSRLSRLASGSSCRSIADGFVEWFEGDCSNNSYAVSLYPPSYWDIVDVVTVVEQGKKEVATTNAQKIVGTSPFFPQRLARINNKIIRLKKFLREKNFNKFGEIIEEEALELHAVILTSKPPLLFWSPETVHIMKLVRNWRRQGLPVFFSINTGHD